VEKIKIDPNAFGYPMPVVLVGSVIDKKPNFLAAAWISRVNYKPPMIGVALGNHYTNSGIRGNKTFSVNIPGVDQVKKTDYCGIVSGKQKDKSGVFEVYYGDLKTAPLIKACPVCMECRLVKEVELGFDTIFIGEIAVAYSEERFLTGGQPDIRKTRPFVLTMPDNTYWEIGAQAGKAWSDGKT
jgi:flavin reductase (DIM6/NTAB) family NADH-FMN oxidoreductase RutF